MSSAPFVSVVTPFYNTERYIAEAIESVLAQTYRDFEYVLLDNCSTDGSLAIAEEYARKDPRIRIERNSTLLDQDLNFSEAFRLMSPDSVYAKMVLADDWIFPRCLEEMVALAEAHPSAGVISSYWLEGTRVRGQGLPSATTTFAKGRDIARLQLQKRLHLMGSPSTVLFRSEIVRSVHPFYDSSVPESDTEACYRAFREWDFGFVHQILSCLRLDDTSRSGLIQDYFPIYMGRYVIASKYGRDFLDEAEYEEVCAFERDRYFRRLGRAMFVRRDPALWEFHRQGLATIGYDLKRAKMLPYAALAVLENVANPGQTARSIMARLRRRGARSDGNG